MICEAFGIDYDHSDKVDHAAAGALVGSASYALLAALWPDQRPEVRFVEALIPVVLVAVAKEVYDRQHPDRHDSDWRDAAATIGGGMLSVSISYRF